MAAKLFSTSDKFGSMRGGEGHAFGGGVVCARRNLKADIAISRSMLRCDRACSDDSDSQVSPWLTPAMLKQRSRSLYSFTPIFCSR
jgi:hypothetical protein